MNSNYIKNGYIVCSCVADAVNNKHTTIKKCESAQDVENRIGFLKAHNLITFFDYVVDKNDFESLLSKDKIVKFSDMVKQAVFRQLKYDLMSDSISSSLLSKGIRHIVLKGTQLKKYYPDNIVRTSNDIDIYVEKKDIESADKVLTDNGFAFDHSYEDHEFIYKKEPRYYVELHTSIGGFGKKQKAILNNIADKTLNSSDNSSMLSNEDCYIHLLCHLYKHFIQSGAGVRMFLDLYLLRKNATLDFDYISEMLRKLNLDGFDSVVTQINRCLFEQEHADEDIQEVIEFIFDSGIFGKSSNTVYLNEVNKNIRYDSSFEQLKAAKGISFAAMKKRYPILERLPILYPFSFIHRLFYGLFRKRDVLKSAYDNKKSMDKHSVEKYERILKISKVNTKNK